MNTYTFIRSSETESYPNPIYAITQEIDELKISETYDRFGQLIDSSNAGDYSIHNEYSDAEYYCLKDVVDHFKLRFKDESNNDKDNKYLYDQLSIQDGEIELENFEDDEIVNFNRNKINKFIKNWEEEKAVYNTVKGFNYWDGRNWQTIVVEDYIFDNPTHTIIEDGTLENEIESKEWLHDGFGNKVYESKNYWIVYNYCQGSFSAYELYSKEEFNLEDI